jgi:mRNA interferase RelE/StbE
LKQLSKIGKAESGRIAKFLMNISTLPSPYLKAQPILPTSKGLWRFRVGDYRVICRIDNEKMIVLAVAVGHRRDVYKKNLH